MFRVYYGSRETLQLPYLMRFVRFLSCFSILTVLEDLQALWELIINHNVITASFITHFVKKKAEIFTLLTLTVGVRFK